MKWISSQVSTLSYVYDFLDWINSPVGKDEVNKFMNDNIGITLCEVGDVKINSLVPQTPTRIPTPTTNAPTNSSPITEPTNIPTKSITQIPSEKPSKSTSSPSSK